MVGKFLATAGAVALMAASTVARAEMPSQINFGIISTEPSANLQKSFQPLLDDMAKSLKVDVKPFFASDYAGVIEGMRFNKVDVAWFGNKSAMVAVDRAGGEIFAQTIKDDGSRGYYSLLITHVDSPLNSLQDVMKCGKQLAFGNGDPNSTSGFLVPSYYVFAKNDQTAENCFKTVLTSNHEGNALCLSPLKLSHYVAS
jgi:phosphonate transport system substrate-binding protein